MMRILVRSPNWIGDQVMAFPFFHYLRQAYPRAHIGVACVPWVESIQFRGYIDEVITLTKPMGSGLGAKLSALEASARSIRASGDWDLGITLPDSFSSAWLLFRGGARRRRGRATDGRSLLLTDREPEDSARDCHRAEAYLRLLPRDASGSTVPATEFWGVRPERPERADALGFTDASAEALQGVLRDEQEQAEQIEPVVPRFDWKKHWPDTDPVEVPEGAYWVLAPGSAAESRRWSLQSFQRLVERVYAETGLKAMIVGGPSEAGLGLELKDALGRKVEDLIAMGTVSSYAPLFAGARFTVANDSGLAHVASLCGSPVQIVWGAGDPKVTQPIGPGKAKLIFNPVDCWPCVRNVCTQPAGNRLACLHGIEADAVWEELRAWVH